MDHRERDEYQSLVESEIVKAISICRREILGLLEAVYGETGQWRFIRAQILTKLGERGLEGRIIGALKENRENGNAGTNGNRIGSQPHA